MDFYEFFQNFPKVSECIRTHPDAPECIRMHPNASKHVGTGPSKSENFDKLAKTLKTSRKISEKLREQVSFVRACTQENPAMEVVRPLKSWELEGCPSNMRP